MKSSDLELARCVFSEDALIYQMVMKFGSKGCKTISGLVSVHF